MFTRKRPFLTLSILLVLCLALIPTQQTAAATLCVNPGGTGGCYSSIQSAINAANPNDVISVEAGAYTETVTVNKDITLQGANSPLGGNAAVVNGVIHVTASGATVLEMKVVPGSVTGNTAGISVSAGNTTVSNNVIDGITGDGSGSVKGIHLYDGSSPATTTMTITGNTIQNIDNLDTSGVGGSSGIMVQGVLDGVMVGYNTVDNITSEGWAYGIEVTPTASEPTTPPKDVTIIANRVSSVNPGITLSTPPAPPYPGVGLTIDIYGTDTADASEVTATYNTFTDIPYALNNRDSANDLSAACNWFDAQSGPTHLTDNPGGTGLEISDNIAFAPWLIYGTDDSTDAGFQLPAAVTVTAPGDVSEALNGFRILENALGCAVDNQTLDLSGTFDWSASTTYANLQYVASFADATSSDIRGIQIPGGVDNLTLTSTAEDAHLIGAGDITDTPSALIYAAAFYSDRAPGNDGLTIENLLFDDFEAAITLGWNATGSFPNTTIQNNEVILAGDDGDATDWVQNIAFYFWVGTNQTIQNNTITFQADGTRTEGYFGPKNGASFGYQCGTSGGSAYDGLLISGNTFQVSASSNGQEVTYGIWENSHNDVDGTSLQLVNNQFLGRSGDDFDHAFLLSSQTNGLDISGNTFNGVDEIFSATSSQGHTAGDAFTFTGNTLINVGGSDGIFLQNVTNDATPITVDIHWHTSNTIDGETGVRGLNELSTDAAHATRTNTAATDLNHVFALPVPVTATFVDDDWSAADRFSDPDGLGTGDTVAYDYNGFDSINAGIAAVETGGTVHVGPGTYSERVIINKSLTLRGATPDASKYGYTVPANYAWDDTVESIITEPTPTVSGNTVDIVNASDVTIEGFVIQNLAADGNTMTGLLRVNVSSGATQHSENIIVRNNIIGPFTNTTAQDGTHGRMGLYLAVTNSGGFGLHNSSFNDNLIFDAQGNGNNVFIWGAANAYHDNGNTDLTGTVIEHNEIYGSHRSGIEIAGGVDHLSILDNHIHHNSSENGGSTDPDLKYGNGIVIIRMGSDKDDSDAYGPTDLTIQGNTIEDNEKHGIYIGPVLSDSLFQENILRSNGLNAIWVDKDETYHGGTWPTTARISNLTFQGNCISANGGYGLETNNDAITLDAENNWWGSVFGPYHPVNNPTGRGDAVSDYVDFSPWLDACGGDPTTDVWVLPVIFKH